MPLLQLRITILSPTLVRGSARLAKAFPQHQFVFLRVPLFLSCFFNSALNQREDILIS